MDITNIMVPVIVILVAIALFLIVYEVLLRFNPDKLQEQKSSSPESIGEFKSNVLLLSKRELEIYTLLRSLIKNKNLLITVKARLSDLVKPVGEEEMRKGSYEGIKDVVADLVVCTRESGRILLVVEVIDSKAEKRSTGTVQKACASAEIPFFLVADEKESMLRSRIASILNNERD